MNERIEADVADLVESLAKSTGVKLERPKVSIRLPMSGVGGPLSKSLPAETIGKDIVPKVDGHMLLIEIPPTRLDSSAKADWEHRLRGLVERVEREGKRLFDS